MRTFLVPLAVSALKAFLCALLATVDVVLFCFFRVKDSVVGNEDSGHIRFFSFSLIEGYISLVMDVQTQQR